MLRSLFTGISGLRAHQTMLDVTGNNIANVNTTGFKASQSQFQDTLSQVVQAAGGAQPGVGGTNPAQVGLGVRVAGITTNFTQGASQLTNRSTDLMISGDGFFIVRNGNETLYSRAGAMDFDASGQLVTPEGALLQGWAATNGEINTNGPLTDLRLPIAAVMPSSGTTTVTMEGNVPATAEAGAVLTREIDVYDALGVARTVVVDFAFDGTAWSVSATDGISTAAGQPISFGADGTTPTVTSIVLGAGTAEELTIDLSSLTGFAGVTSVEASYQDGAPAGTLQSFSLSPDGTLIGAFSNGLKQAIGRVALSTFTNPPGLEKAGGNLYRVTVNSGDPQIGTAGTGGRGTLAGGALEMSNVDLSQEFTNLIVAQRGFQANSRVITTSDEVLQELVNLKR